MESQPTLQAQRSTGPRTEEGKQKSSKNAMKDGVYSQDTIVAGESLEQFQAFEQSIIDAFHPGTSYELSIAKKYADVQWRIRRVERIEQITLNQSIEQLAALPPDQALALGYSLADTKIDRLQRQAARLRRDADKLKKEFDYFYKIRMNSQPDRHTHHISEKPHVIYDKELRRQICISDEEYEQRFGYNPNQGRNELPPSPTTGEQPANM